MDSEVPHVTSLESFTFMLIKTFANLPREKITAKANFLRNLILAKLGECKYILKKKGLLLRGESRFQVLF